MCPLPGVHALRDADPILTTSPGSVTDFQIRQLPALRVRRERGDPVPVDIIKAQLGTRMRTLTTNDDSHSFRPAGQIEHPCQFGHISTVAGFPIGVIGRLPSTEFRQLAIQLGSVAGKHPAH
jgi:hypothetical protein